MQPTSYSNLENLWVDESQLRQAMAAFFEQSFNAILITDATMELPGPRILYVNPALCRMTGYSAAELIGQTPRLFQGPNTNFRVIKRLKSDLQAGNPFHGATTNYKKDGTPYHVEWNITPIKHSDGRPYCYISIQKDLTALKHLVQRFKATNEGFRHFLGELRVQRETDHQVDPWSLVHQSTLIDDLKENARLYTAGLRTPEQAEHIEQDQEFYDFMDGAHGVLPDEPGNRLSATIWKAKSPVTEKDLSKLITIAKSMRISLELSDGWNNSSQEYRNLARQLQQCASILFFTRDYQRISTILTELANAIHNQPHIDFPEILVEAFRTLVQDLNILIHVVFEECREEDAQNLDCKIIASAQRLLLFLQ